MKGLLALDIDGTLTDQALTVPEPMSAYLTRLAQSGWQVAFLTGRPFSFAHAPLKNFSFPYYLAVQNGSTLLKMLEKEILYKIRISRAYLSQLVDLFSHHRLGFLIESGLEGGDKTYFCPSSYSHEELEYLKFREDLGQAPFVALPSFDALPLDAFPLIKLFGKEGDLKKACRKAVDLLSVKTSVVHDPFREGYAVGLLTAEGVDKARALRHLMALHAYKGKLITAGDDDNDREFLALGQVRIVMGDAPPSLLEMATIIAKPAKEMGLLQALEEALKE